MRGTKGLGGTNTKPAYSELFVGVVNDRLTISIGIETLRYAIMQGEAFRNEFSDWEAEITDPLGFASALAERLSDLDYFNPSCGALFDKLARDLMEDGHESIRIDEDIANG